MYKLSINKDLFDSILLKKIKLLEKEKNKFVLKVSLISHRDKQSLK